MFGRERDLHALQDRVRFKGLTAVVARPQMGKSWLLTELARRLAHEHNPPHAVGFAESFGQTPDLLARAVADLYVRWLSDAGMAEQARMVWKQQKGNLLGGVAGTVSKIFSEVFGNVAKPVTVAVDEGIKGLIAANATLTSGGLKLPTLQYEQARDLVAAVGRISGRPVALFLDQWERSPDAKLESRTLEAFLHHLNEWPACHMFLALRPDEPIYTIVENVAESLSGAAQVYPLELLDLKDDAARDALLRFLNWQVPAVRGLPEQHILAAIDGYPGVIYQWTSEFQRETMHSAGDLDRVAADAHEYRFSELDTLLPKLQADARRLAVRLALLPLTASSDAWKEIKPQVCDGLDPEILDDLRLDRVLESAEPPSFGHVKRWEAARDWFVENRTNTLRSEAQALVLAFASQIRGDPVDAVAATFALIRLQAPCQELNLPDLHLGLCEAALTVSGESGDSSVIGRAAPTARKEPRAAPLMAVGLVNTHAKEENANRRDALLDELRALARAHPDNAAVRENLAIGLFNAFHHAKAKNDLVRRDALHDELRELAEAHGEDAALREWLAKGLFNTLISATEEGDLGRRDALLQELRVLEAAHSEDATVREWVVKALFNALYHAKGEGDLGRRDALLQELRVRAAEHSEDVTVREELARSLFNMRIWANEEDDLVRCDALLDELRTLASSHLDDAVLREWLVRALFNTLYAKADDQPVRRDAWLEELQALARAHGEDAVVREGLARGLSNTLYHAKANADVSRRDALVDEIRGLAALYPEDATVREQLAWCLSNTLYHAKGEDDLGRRDALLEELRTLAGAHGEDAAVREWLANGLLNALNYAKEEKELGRRDTLLDELRALAEAYPDNEFVQEAWRQVPELMSGED
ncbi:MAG: hypothetical protein ACXW3X_11180 [Rhodoplanes sp.]